MNRRVLDDHTDQSVLFGSEERVEQDRDCAIAGRDTKEAAET
jgi:hypothetical protein